METQEEYIEEVDEEGPQEEVVDPKIEEEATRMGWRKEFKGNGFRTAEEYVARGREMLPIMKSQMGKYEDKIKTLETTLEDQKKTAEKLIKISEKVSEQAYERAKTDIMSQQRKAVEEGNVEEFDRLEQERDSLKMPEITEVQKVEEAKEPNAENPNFVEWHKTNEWYLKDEDATIFANAYGETLPKNMDYNMWLKSVEDKVKKTFPRLVENPNRTNVASVDSSGQRGTDVSTDKHSYQDLPADAKAQCAIYVKQGKTREEYVSLYYSED